MRILYILQQSIFNNEGKWVSADSNISMTVGLLRALQSTEYWKDIYIDLVIGRLEDFCDIKSFDELFKDDHVKFIEYNIPVNPFINRQHFDTNFWLQILDKNYDVIINNLTEQSRNIKTILEVLNRKTKLITQCFWLDCPTIGEAKVPESYSYDWRQFDGAECSDLFIFTCESTQQGFVKNSLNKFDYDYIKKILDKSSIWDLGYSALEAEEYWHKMVTNYMSSDFGLNFFHDKKRILFLNRLSGINYTHHEEFINCINKISSYRNDFEVYFTNPSGKFSKEWLKSNCKNYVPLNIDHLSKLQYWQLLYDSNISIHLFTIERNSGCSLRESIHAGNITVVANCFEQKKLIDIEQLKVDINDDRSINVVSLENCINYALDNCNELWDKFHKIRKQNEKQSSIEAQIHKIYSDIQGVLA